VTTPQPAGAERAQASPILGIVVLLLIATAMGSNHVASRVAFDHGASVPTAVLARAGLNAVFTLLLVRSAGLSLALPRLTLARAALVGAMLTVQSLCIASAVARMPVALALLVFNTFPITLAVLSWASGGERPSRRAMIAMPVAFAGLALALGARPGAFAGGASHDYLVGVLLAATASLSFGSVLLLTTRWLGGVDGRVRTLVMMSVIVVLTLALGPSVGGFRMPADAAGWTGLALLALLYSGGITTLFVVLPRLGAVNNSAVLNFEPIAAMGMAWLVLDQAMVPLQLAGAALVVAAIVSLSLGARRG
jgi:drug/metabolite transporter (DMT)-like permease